MKTEIKLSNILMDYKLDHITLDEAENKILLLFSVSGRSEQLKAFIEWQKWDYKKPYDTPTDEIVSDYESL